MRWVVDGLPVLIGTRESPVAGDWELCDRVESTQAPGEIVEMRLPTEPEPAARYYRFESALDATPTTR